MSKSSTLPMSPPHSHARRLKSLLVVGLLTSLSLPITAVSASPLIDWTVPTATGPTPSVQPYLSYDSARNRAVLFGGATTTGAPYYADTWEFDGTNWSKVATTGPSGRALGQMVFDSARGVSVLFGGANASYTFFGETWEWNGSTWVQRLPAVSPSPRAWFGMTYDTTRHRTVLFGGYSGANNLNDTWEYDGANWSQVLTAHSPPARFATQLSFDSGRNRVVMFGGDGGSRLNDTWEYDGTDWTQVVTANSPAPRFWHSMSYDPGRHRTVVFGGDYILSNTLGPNNETWEYDGSTWAQLFTAHQPSPRIMAPMVYDSALTKTLLFGGSDESGQPDVALGDSWLLGIVPEVTTTAVVNSTNPAFVGQPVVYTASVSPTPDGGSVTFTDAGATIPGCGAQAVNIATGTASCSVTYSFPGRHDIVAFYGGDLGYAPSTSPALDESVVYQTSTNLTTSANPALVGQVVTFAATVSPAPDGGTVAFSDGGTTIAGCDTRPVSPGGLANCSVSYSGPGTHRVVASYGGDASYAASASSQLNEAVVYLTSTSLAAPANPALVGQSVVYTATVSPAPDGGTVTFSDGGQAIDGCAAQAINSGTGQSTCSVTYVSPASHSIGAAYSGDANYTSSSSASLAESVSYRIILKYDSSASYKSGTTVPVALQIDDLAGDNLSSSTVTVHILCVLPQPATTPSAWTCWPPPYYPINTDFSFLTRGPLSPGYLYLFDTSGYPLGAYELLFTAGSDPVVHAAPVNIATHP